jgi:magnesium-protoporphyrin O-methyltransferase
MGELTYIRRRGQLKAYFGRTAADAWARLTSDGPVSRIRATVRAGRDEMRDTLLGWLPRDLSGRRVLDAGCGTGALAVACAQRGAEVVAIDLSDALVGLARERTSHERLRGRIDFRVGDMLDRELGTFDHVVAMDSFIHYAVPDTLDMVSALAERARESLLFTFAPRTPMLTVMLWMGKLFPRRDRAPAIVPVSERTLRRRLAGDPRLADWRPEESVRISRGFYTSQALRVVTR